VCSFISKFLPYIYIFRASCLGRPYFTRWFCLTWEWNLIAYSSTHTLIYLSVHPSDLSSLHLGGSMHPSINICLLQFCYPIYQSTHLFTHIYALHLHIHPFYRSRVRHTNIKEKFSLRLTKHKHRAMKTCWGAEA
jgi:hypothetical protein